MSNLKKSHLVRTAEFIIAQEIVYKPAFNWWVKYVLKKRDRIITSIRKWQTKDLKKSHKIGIELPMTVKQVHYVNAKNGNTL